MDYDIFDDSTTFQLISITMLSNPKSTIDFVSDSDLLSHRLTKV